MTATQAAWLCGASAVIGIAGTLLLAPRQAPPPAPATFAVAVERDVAPPSSRAEPAPSSTARTEERSASSAPSRLTRRQALEQAGADAIDQRSTAFFDQLAMLEKKDEREAYLRGAFERATQLGVDAALTLVRSLERRADRDTALLTLLRAWSGATDTEIATDLASRPNTSSPTSRLGLFLLDRKSATPAQVARLAEDFLTGRERATLLGESASVLARSDPAAAFALGEKLTGEDQSIFLRQFAIGWAEANPAAAWAWAAQVPDAKTRIELQERIVQVESVKNLPAALEHFRTLPAESDVRARAAAQIAFQWAATDTVAAQRWIDTLASPEEHAAATSGLQSSAPVGIGVVLKLDADGVASMDALIPDGAAMRSGALQPGDRIVGITDAAGQWVDARQLPLQDLVNLIRGRPGTTVSLRVLGSSAPADAQPRVVSMTRQQIVHRPEATRSP